MTNIAMPAARMTPLASHGSIINDGGVLCRASPSPQLSAADKTEATSEFLDVIGIRRKKGPRRPRGRQRVQVTRCLG